MSAWCRGWSVWGNRPAVVAYVLAVDAVALLVMVAAVAGERATVRDAVTTGLLAVGAAVHGLVTRRVEQAREIAADRTGYADPYAVWTFAGVCLLPPGPASLLVGLVYACSRRWVIARPPLHRTVFTAAAVVIAARVAGELTSRTEARELLGGHVHGVGAVLVLAAGVVYTAVNLALVVGVVSLAAPTTPWRLRLGPARDHAYELAGLSVAVSLAVTAQVAVWLVPALLVPLFTAHRSLLCTRLLQAVRTDDKTGLATSAHWHAEAERTLAHALRRHVPVSVLMIDLDNFKAVNDTHGHLAGDQVLRAVATSVAAGVAEGDLVGRFGGEEYVALLRDAPPARALAVAEGIRAAVAALAVAATTPAGVVDVDALTVSVGVATSQETDPRGSSTLDGLLLAADTALYGAKHLGRNRVLLADEGVRARCRA